MTRPGWTLAGRLTRSLTIGLTLCWVLGAALASLMVRYELNEVFDSVLQETAQHMLPDILRNHAAVLEGPASAEVPDTLPAVPHDEYVTYQVLSVAGVVRLRSHQAPSAAYLLPVTPGFAWDGAGRRVYTELSVDGRFAIQIAEPAGHRQEAVWGAILLLLLPLAGLLPVVVWLIRHNVRGGLAPVTQLQREVAARGGGNLSPLPASRLPEELALLVTDMNQLLSRLAKALESERSFARNSAHELRTPIAAALVQTQLLAAHLGEATPMGERALAIAAELRRMGRLAERLLQLARAEAGVAASMEVVDLLPLLRLLVEEFAAEAGPGRITVETNGIAAFPVRGDLDALGIALRNLLENALRHGEPDMPVRFTLGPGRRLSLRNAAPPIPPAALEQLKRPFQRHNQHVAGTGLGLAIVDRIMRQAGGALLLHAPPPGAESGFETVLEFPPAP